MARLHQHIFSFEAPLYRKPSHHFRDFMKKLETSDTPCYALRQNNGKLTFQMSNSERASITPCVKNHSEMENIAKQLSVFASKFNATTSMVMKKEARMWLEIRDKKVLTKKRYRRMKKKYSNDVMGILRVTVTTNNKEVLNALTNFFKMLDTYGN